MHTTFFGMSGWQGQGKPLVHYPLCYGPVVTNCVSAEPRYHPNPAPFTFMLLAAISGII